MTISGVSKTPCDVSDGDIAWMLVSTVLVLSMFPGVAFFEAGLLRKKNTTSLLAQVFCGLTVLSVMWICFGFSLTFGGDVGGFIGTFQHAFFINVKYNDCYHSGATIPTALFALFQMMFACITPMLMTGAYAERLAWKPFLIFTVAWEVLVYYPVAHWMWQPQGWLAQMGAQDFAGGIVLHTTAGCASLVAVAMLGHRHNFAKYHGEFPYSSLPTAAIGATLLWTGWFGFNGGSAFGANSQAIAAVVNSQIGASSSALIYMIITGWKTGRPSTIAMMNGAIGGLAGVTPASGFIHPQAALLLGAMLGVSIPVGIHFLKMKLKFDDALDVSTVHGITGIIGSLYIGFASSKEVNPAAADGVVLSGGKNWHLLGVQLLAVVVCGAWAGLWTFIILKTISRFIPLRVHHTHERIGLDQAIFDEVADRLAHLGGTVNIPNGSITSHPTGDSFSAVPAHHQGNILNDSASAVEPLIGGSSAPGLANSITPADVVSIFEHTQRNAPTRTSGAGTRASGVHSTRGSMGNLPRPNAATLGLVSAALAASKFPSPIHSRSVSSQSEEEDPMRREETIDEQRHDMFHRGHHDRSHFGGFGGATRDRSGSPPSTPLGGGGGVDAATIAAALNASLVRSASTANMNPNTRRRQHAQTTLQRPASFQMANVAAGAHGGRNPAHGMPQSPTIPHDYGAPSHFMNSKTSNTTTSPPQPTTPSAGVHHQVHPAGTPPRQAYGATSTTTTAGATTTTTTAAQQPAEPNDPLNSLFDVVPSPTHGNINDNDDTTAST